MDIKKERKKSRIFIIKLFCNKLFLLIGLIALITISLMSTNNFKVVLEASNLSTSVIKDFNVMVRANGFISARETLKIVAPENGSVGEIYVTPGEYLNAGFSTLLVLENSDLSSELRSIESEMNSLLIRREISLAESELKLIQFQSGLADLKLSYDKTLVQFNAEEKLKVIQGNSTSSVSHEISRLTLESLKQRLNSYELSRKKIVSSSTLVKQLYERELKTLRKKHSQLEASIGALSIESSSSGKLSDLFVSEGEYVKKGDVLAAVYLPSSVYALLKINESEIGKLNIGQDVSLTIDNSKYNGVISTILPTVSDGQIQIEIDFDNKGRVFFPNQKVFGEIVVKALPQVMVVKRPSMVSPYSQKKMFIVRKGENLARKAHVRFGETSLTHVQILGGINEGDRIVLNHNPDWETKEVIKIREITK